MSRDRISITIDTREQTPWGFPTELATVRVGTLKTGDYALTGDTCFAIERKSLDDFIGTVTTGWERFQRELDRMDNMGFRAKPIIVEADFQSCCFVEESGRILPPQHSHMMITPAFIGRRIAELVYNHRCSVLFAGFPEMAAALALKILQQRQDELDFTLAQQKAAR